MRKFLIALAVSGMAVALVNADAPKKPEEMACCPIDPKAAASLEKLKKLEGTWTMSAPGQPPMSVVFKPTSGGSAVIETMFPGTEKEMINLYTAAGDKILLTHYCMLGQQPRMKQAASGDDKTMKFEFVDGGNIVSRDEGHMDALALKVDGDTLTETWTFYADGKATKDETFTFKRQTK